MENTFNYSLLWKTSIEEGQSNELVNIDKNFYIDALNFINTLKSSDLGTSKKDNAKKILINLFEKRKKKIAIYAAYNKPIPQTLPKIEQDLYLKILSTIKNTKIESNEIDEINKNKPLETLNDNNISNTNEDLDITEQSISQSDTCENNPSEITQEGNLKALIDIPEIILPSGQKLGPIHKDEIFKISNNGDINFITTSNLAIEV